MKLRNIFKHKQLKPKPRILYAITNGIYMGVCVIFVKPENHPKNGVYPAMAIGNKDFDGGMEAMEIPETDVIKGLESHILDKIKKVPKELYELCCNEYYERVRRKEQI